MKRSAVVCILVTLAGCAGTQTGMGVQVQTGSITLDEIDAAKGLYRVGVLNGVDFDWDGGVREDREKAVKFVLADTCSRFKILSDTPLPMGNYTFTTKRRIKYSMTVQCLSADSTQPAAVQ